MQIDIPRSYQKYLLSAELDEKRANAERRCSRCTGKSVNSPEYRSSALWQCFFCHGVVCALHGKTNMEGQTVHVVCEMDVQRFFKRKALEVTRENVEISDKAKRKAQKIIAKFEKTEEGRTVLAEMRERVRRGE